MDLDELRATAAQSANTLRDQRSALTRAAQQVSDEGKSVLAVLGKHRAASMTGSAIQSSVGALERAAAHCEQAAVAIDEWIGSNY
jgi:hypothetical protein